MRIQREDYQAVVLPAYAGMIPIADFQIFATNCAPRVCGDDPLRRWRAARSFRVLPAYAGMIRGAPGEEGAHGRAPRVCGDDPRVCRMVPGGAACSPRMRG